MRTNKRIFPRIHPRLFERDASLAGFGLVDSGALLVFHAAWADAAGVNQTLLTGTGPVTTDHAESIYAPDHEGVYREFDVDEPVWKGGRVVENLVLYSDEPSNLGGWYVDGVVGAATRVDNADGSVTVTSQGDGDRAFVRQDVSLIAGHTYILTTTFDNAPAADGTWANMAVRESVDHLFYNDSSGRVALAFTATATGTGSIRIGIGCLTGSNVVADSFTFREFQLEDSTGRSDTTTPSEYIATTTAPVQKVFDYANGSTVDGNGVVTEARGAAFADAPYLVAQDEGTNYILQSKTLTITWGSIGNASVTITADGLDGTPNSASTCYVEGAGNNITQLRAFTGTAGDPIGVALFFKRVTTTGTLRFSNPYSAASGEWYIDLSLVPDGYVVLTSDHAAVTEVNPFIMNASGCGCNFQNTVAAGIDFIIGNINYLLNATLEQVKSIGPIFTTTAAATTSAFDNEYPAANHSNTEGPLYLEFENTGDDVVLVKAGTDEFLRIEDGGSVEEAAGGNFDNSGDWTVTADWTVSGGKAVCTATVANRQVYQNSSVVTGTPYQVDFDVVAYTSGYVYARLRGVQGVARNSVGHYSETIIAGSLGSALGFIGSGSGFVGEVDNISVREVDGKYLKLTDGTTQLQAACAAGEHKVGIAFDADNNLMNLNLDGTWADLTDSTAYDGTLGSGVLTLGETERNVKRWNETDFDKQKAIIDKEMA